ncbi:MAG: aminopeptidase [Planctomycetota bacterium]
MAAGCSPGYVLQQAAGQLKLLASRRPIEEVLADPATPAGARERLILIREARAWGEREFGLKHTDSYESYVDLKGRPVSWLVTACPPDSLKPESWWFPVVGRVPYLGFFDLDDARAEKEALEAKGLDVNVRSVPAYSTLGWFSDPVFSTFVQWPVHTAVDTIFHETTHATVWIPGSVSTNEALADVVGEQGARKFLAVRFGPDSPELAAFESSQSESNRFHVFALELNAALKEAYALDLPRAEKLEMKAAILRRGRERFRTFRDRFTSRYYREFDRLEWNNALIASIAVYREEEATWRALFDLKGGDLRAFLDAAKAIAAAPDPEAALKIATGRAEQIVPR